MTSEHTGTVAGLALRFCLMFGIVVGLIACGERPLPSIKHVDPKVIELLDQFKTGDVETLLALYSEDFYKSRPKGVWKMQLEKLFNTHGPAVRYSFRNKQADTRFRGKFYIYQYDTIHDKEKRVKHIITFVHPVDREAFDLVGHKMTGAGL